MTTRPAFSRRIPYHMDGTVAFWHNEITNESTQFTALALDAMNANRQHSVLRPQQADWVTLIFPVPMKIYGMYFTAGQGVDRPQKFETSKDTTTSIDGTWDPLGVYPPSTSQLFTDTGDVILGNRFYWYSPVATVAPAASTTGHDVLNTYLADYDRDGEGIHRLSGANLRGVVAIRFDHADESTVAAFLLNLHLYGEPDLAPAERLEIVRASGAILAAQSTDFGQRLPNTTSPAKEYRVRNRSTDKQAIGVQISSDDLTLSSKVPFDWPEVIEFSINGTTLWSPTISLGDLAPDASASFYVRVATGPAGNYGNASVYGRIERLIVPTVEEWVDA